MVGLWEERESFGRMGGSGVMVMEDGGVAELSEWEELSTPPPPPPPPPSLLVPNPTIVLVGRTGNGKSATGNSILGCRAFKSMSSSTAITTTSQLRSALLSDGRSINVIDTPGFFDATIPTDIIGKEILKCIDLVMEGVHALLLVLSTRNRFSKEELASVKSLEMLFGPKVMNYMIVVFTGGDDLEDNDQCLDDYLSADTSAPIMDLLKRCGNRKLLFNNKTKDEVKQQQQLYDLLHLINKVFANNEGQPYSNNLFQKTKERSLKFSEQGEQLSTLRGYSSEQMRQLREDMERDHAEQLRQVISMIEEKMGIHTAKLEERLAQEQLAREEAERRAQAAKVQSDADIRNLREEVEKSNREREEFRRRMESKGNCTIL